MSTINITGTGGIIEGNLGAANVNVNLDAALEFDGVNDLISVGNIGTHAQWTISFWAKKVGTGEDGLIDGNDASSSSFPYITANPSNFYVYYASGGGAANTSFAVDMSVWNHFAITYDAEATNNLKTYCNGVLKTTVDANNTSAPTTFTDFTIGDNANYGKWDGFMADVKTFNDDLAIEDIQILASKINVDPTLVSKTANLTGWWKVNDAGSTINDFVNETNSGTDHNGTLTGGDWRYNEYCVDVYDNSTTTDGTFTVTQGKVEGLSLTSGRYGGSDGVINCGSPATLDNTFATDASWAAWIKADNDGENNEARIVSKNQWILHVEDESSSTMKLGFDSAFSSTNGKWNSTNRDITVGKWHHVAVVYNGSSVSNDPVLYIDGVAVAVTESQTPVGSVDADASSDLVIGNDINGTRTFHGNIKDVRYYDYELSAEQAASLYSNTYSQTPNHYWRINEGTGTAIEDEGTETDADGTAADSFTWVNGTLDLDGTLTIAANGTLSAPRGDLELAGNFTIAADTSTFTHNNGTVEILGNVELLPADFDSSENERHIFYNILHTSHTLYIERPTTIENQYTKTGGTARQYTKTTFGTDTHAGEMIINNGNWSFYGYYGSPTLQAANQLFPLEVKGSGYSSDGPIDWDTINNEARSPDTFNYIKWIDFQKDMVTGGNGGDAVMLGDCEFDAFTISSGDSLDLNGQRAEFSGLLKPEGANGLQDGAGGAHIVTTAGINYSSNAQHSSLQNVTYIQRASDTHYLSRLNFGRIALLGVSPSFGNYGPSYTAGVTDLIVGCTGTVSNLGTEGSATTTAKVDNMTIATGSTVNASNHTLTVAGDFTTSGGLLGASCLTLDGTTEYASTVSAVAVGTNSAWTIEGWMKRTTSTGNEVFVELKTASNNNNRVFFNIDTDDVQMLIYSNGGSQAVVATANQGLNDDKWHHVACTYDSTTAKIYIDGKLITSEVISKTMDNTDDRIINVGANVGTYANGFTGSIDEVRIWSDVRTEAEIRANMFTEVSDSASGLVQYWKFNEGTGSSASASAGNSLGTYDNGSSATDLWAGAGTFTQGTSTLVMSGSSKKLTWTGNENVGNLQISGTTTLEEINGNDGYLQFNGTLTVDASKTLASTSAERLIWNSSSDTIVINNAATGLSGLYALEAFHTSGTVSLPACTTPRLKCWDGGTTQATGDITLTTELEVNSGTTFNANGNTISCKEVDVNDGTLNLSNSTMSFYTQTSDELNLTSGSTLITGNTTLTGYSAALPTNIFCPDTGSAGNFEVVGDVSNFKMQGVSDLTVIGSVTDCVIADGNTTAIIRQWHHTLDTQQLLDADSAGDDDLRLTKPALDNALELMTK